VLRIIVEIVPPAGSRPPREVACAELANIAESGKAADYSIEAEEEPPPPWMRRAIEIHGPKLISF